MNYIMTAYVLSIIMIVLAFPMSVWAQSAAQRKTDHYLRGRWTEVCALFMMIFFAGVALFFLSSFALIFWTRGFSIWR